MSTKSGPHISVCVCSYKRAALLPDLIRAIETQRTDGQFTYEVFVADNDVARSAESIVQQLARAATIPISYCLEPEMNIALARNAAVARATGDFVVFIDDDEVPTSDWLYELLTTQAAYSADAVLGPVVSRFQQQPPAWVTKGGFFDRPRHPTGHLVQWPEARTGNVLLVRKSMERLKPPFRPQFGSGGEDVDFFRRLAEQGGVLVWSNEAVAYELVPPYRCTRRFLAGRALLRGSNFPKQSGQRARNVVKSLIAVPCYTVALPVLALIGHHMFIAYAMKLLEHSSRLLSLAGVQLATERQT
jgi:glycosyltransferase involved in cell wall biosynthesis